MSARDELAYVIVQHPWIDSELFGVANWPKGYCPTCGKIIDAGHNSPAHAEHIADAILAAGYRKIFDGDCGLSGIKDPDDRDAAEAWMRWVNPVDVTGAGLDGIAAMKLMLTELGYRKVAGNG